MFDTPAPRVFTIAPGRSSARALAEGMMARLGDADPIALARVTIYAPTRRGARTLVEAFVELAGGKPILAPRILTLADLDDPMGLTADLPEAIGATERLLTLTRLVRGMAEAAPHLAQEATATALARDLMSLLDQIHGERLDLDALEHVAPENHAEHWSETLKFLHILRDAWPTYLASVSKMDPVARRAELIARQVAAWQAEPPTDPVIVAGSTGSVGISAELIAAVAHLPQGAVILPGLDRELEADAFRALGDDHPDHPQAGLSRLLAHMGGHAPIPRDSIPDWMAGNAQQRFLSITLRPAPATDAWLAKRGTIRDLAPDAMANVALIEAETPQEEAQAIAFAIREAVAEPERTVALVTTDRLLARRVSAALKRWNITADDSAGRPLHLTPPGVFLSLLVEEGLRPPGAGDPARFLALLKHPLTYLGLERPDHLAFVRTVEIKAIRRNSTGADTEAIRRVFADKPDMLDWLDTLDDALAPLRALMAQEKIPLSDVMTALRVSAEALSLRPDGGVEVWEKETGQAALAFVDDITDHASSFGALAPDAVPMLLAGLIAGCSARAPYGQHPRVFIWGTLEARMLCADTMILGALNEDGWPKLPNPDPWMSRAMRRDFGLPPLERRIGLSAHDFQQAMAAPKAILTRARKQDGAPTVASRWLQRITTLLGEGDKGFAPDVLTAMRKRGIVYLGYARHTGRIAEGAPCERPNPEPPVEARPHELRVTEIETLIRDPYAIYAYRVLGLAPLDELTPEPDARNRGNVMHDIVEQVVRDWGDAPDALWESATEEALKDVAAWPVVQAFYRARAERIAPWFLAEEAMRREARHAPVVLEGNGQSVLDVEGYGPVALNGRADRIDRIGDGYAIYDYKTGAPPTEKQVTEFAQQLPLEAAMVQAGDFDIEPRAVEKLAYIHLAGGKAGGNERALQALDDLVGQAFPRLRQLLRAYADPARGYLSRARPQTLTYASDYDHLARVGEWKNAEGGEE